MYVTGVTVRGLGDLPSFSASELGRLVSVHGPSPATTALGDALELAFAAFSAPGLERLLRRWGVLATGEKPEVLGDPLPEQARWADREAARELVADAETRAITVSVELALDPPLFAALRAEAPREPRLVAAMSGGAPVTVEVGALFAASYDALAIAIHGVLIGDERFPAREAERAPWLRRLLGALAGRFHRHDPSDDTAEAALAGAVSRSAHGGYLAWQGCLGPGEPVLRAASGPGGRPVILAGDRPLRRLGAAREARAALGASTHLFGADVVWAESDDPWLDGAVSGSGSALEQVWRVSGEGALVVESDDLPAPSAFRPG